LQTDGTIFRYYLLISVATFCLKRNENPAEMERNVSILFFKFVKQRFFYDITMRSKWYRNGPLVTKRFRNGSEMVHLQRNDSLQWIETGCETFLEKRFENYLAMVLQ
jgi:hypothetical protein